MLLRESQQSCHSTPVEGVLRYVQASAPLGSAMASSQAVLSAFCQRDRTPPARSGGNEQAFVQLPVCQKTFLLVIRGVIEWYRVLRHIEW